MKHDIMIPANSQVVVPAKTNFVSLKHTTALMEPISIKVIEEGILMANCFVNPGTADKYIPIRLINFTNEDVALQKDSNTGQLSEVELTKILFESENDPGQAVTCDDVVGQVDGCGPSTCHQQELWCPELEGCLGCSY